MNKTGIAYFNEHQEGFFLVTTNWKAYYRKKLIVFLSYGRICITLIGI
jgi:hypothetical protein